MAQTLTRIFWMVPLLLLTAACASGLDESYRIDGLSPAENGADGGLPPVVPGPGSGSNPPPDPGPAPDSGVTPDSEPPPPPPGPQNPGPSCAQPLFADVPSSCPYYPAIQWAGCTGVMRGCQDIPSWFCPAASLTRAELTQILIDMKHGAGFAHTQAQRFADVPPSHWAFGHVQRLADDVAAAGCGAGKFCPGASIPRWEAARLIAELKFGTSFLFPKTPIFSDVPASHPGFKQIQKLGVDGISIGCGNGKFCPADPLRRQECAALLHEAQSL